MNTSHIACKEDFALNTIVSPFCTLQTISTRAFVEMTFTYTLSERRSRTDEVVEEAEKTAESHSSSSSVSEKTFPALQASKCRFFGFDSL